MPTFQGLERRFSGRGHSDPPCPFIKLALIEICSYSFLPLKKWGISCISFLLQSLEGSKCIFLFTAVIPKPRVVLAM